MATASHMNASALLLRDFPYGMIRNCSHLCKVGMPASHGRRRGVDWWSARMCTPATRGSGRLPQERDDRRLQSSCSGGRGADQLSNIASTELRLCTALMRRRARPPVDGTQHAGGATKMLSLEDAPVRPVEPRDGHSQHGGEGHRMLRCVEAQTSVPLCGSHVGGDTAHMARRRR